MYRRQQLPRNYPARAPHGLRTGLSPQKSFFAQDFVAFRTTFHLKIDPFPTPFCQGSREIRKLERETKCCKFICISRLGTISAILGNSGKNIKTRLEKDQHRARFCLPTRTNKIDKQLSQKQPKMLPKWSLERSRGVPRPPRELQSALLGTSNNPPGPPTSPPRLPKWARGVSEGPPGGHWELKMGARRGIWASKWRPGAAFGPSHGDLGGLPKNEKQTMRF